MGNVTAFVGHSFTDEDKALGASFTEFFDSVARVVPEFNWDHATIESPLPPPEKVLQLFEGAKSSLGFAVGSRRSFQAHPRGGSVTGELLARLRVLVRSRRSAFPKPARLNFKNLTVDLAAHQVTRSGRSVSLTRKEFDVLALLARNAGRLVTQKQLLTTVWGPAHVEDTQYLRVAVSHIREKIGDHATDPTFILTEPGVGYRLLA